MLKFCNGQVLFLVSCIHQWRELYLRRIYIRGLLHEIGVMCVGTDLHKSFRLLVHFVETGALTTIIELEEHVAITVFTNTYEKLRIIDAPKLHAYIILVDNNQ